MIIHYTTNKIEDKSEIKYNCGQTSSDKEIKTREKVRISIKKVEAKFADNLLTKEEADLLEVVLVDDMEITISEEIKLFRMNSEFCARRQRFVIKKILRIQIMVHILMRKILKRYQNLSNPMNL